MALLRKPLRFFLYLGAGLLLLSFLLAVGIIGLLRTDTGQRFIEQSVLDLTEDGPITVQLEGLQGALPWRMEISRLDLLDTQGLWFSGGGLVLELSLRDLWSLRARLPLIHADFLRLHRQPALPESPETQDEATPFDLNDLSLPQITVDELSIDRLELGQDVQGHELLLQATGRIVLAKNNALVELEASNLDRPADSLRLKAYLSGEPQLLSIDAELQEEAGGWIAEVLGSPVDNDLLLKLSGQGPLEDWQGDLRLRIPQFADMDARLLLHGISPVDLDLYLRSRVDPGLLPEQLKRPLGCCYTLAGSALWQDNAVHLRRLRLRSSGTAEISVQASGRFNSQTRKLDAALIARANHPAAFLQDPDFRIDGPLALDIEAQGPVDQPSLNLKLQAASFSYQNSSVDSFTMDIQAEPLAPLSENPDLNIQLRGLLTEVLWPGLDQPRSWDMQGRLQTKGLEKLESAEVELSSQGVSLRVQASGEPTAPDLAGTIGLEIDGFSKFPEYFSGITGSAALNAQWRLLPDLGYEVVLDGKTISLGGLPIQIFALLGSSPSLRSRLTGDKNAVALEHLVIEGQSAMLNASGNLNLADELLQAEFSLDIPEISPLLPQVNATGPLTTNISLQGPLGHPEVEVFVNSPGLNIESQPLNDLNLTLHATDPLDSGQASLHFTALYKDDPIDLQANLLQNGTQIDISDFSLTGPGISANADLHVETANGLLYGNVTMESRDITLLPNLGQPVLGGQLDSVVKLNSDSNGSQQALVDVQILDLATPYGTAKDLSINAQLDDILRIPGGQVELSVSDFNRNNVVLESLRIQASGKPNDLELHAVVQGQNPFSLSLDTLARIQSKVGQRMLIVDRLEGELAGRALHLDGSARFIQTGSDFSLSHLQLILADSLMAIEASRKDNNLDGLVRLNNLNLDLLDSLDLPVGGGTAEALLEISGSAYQPELTLDAELKSFTLPGRPDLPSDLSIKGNLINDRATAEFTLRAPYGQEGHGWIAIPFGLQLDPWEVILQPDATLDGMLQAPINLETIPLIAGLDDLRLEGSANIDIHLSGEVKQPSIEGSIYVQDALIEHYSTGAYLQDISGHVQVNDRELHLLSLTAGDGQGGTLSAKGTAALREAEMNYNLEARLDKTKLVHRTEFDATASGTINISGTTERADLRGDIFIDKAEIRIPDRLPGAVVELPVTEINAPEVEKPAQKQKISFPLDMDVQIDIPARCFVRGRGLDSEWKGNLNIAGKPEELAIVGKLEVVRGRYELLGKRFEVAKGVLTFTGSSPPEPFMDVTAEAENQNLTVRVLLSGPVSSPTILLESTPTLPQDEILSRLIFDKDLANISGMQALRLAEAARQLAGGGSDSEQNLDALTQIRELLQLDDLEVSQSPGDKGLSVGAGTYINEDVYLELNKSLVDDRDRIRVEIELNPNLNLESQVGTDGQGGLGLNWKYEY